MKNKKQIIILPMDNYANGEKLLDAFEKIMKEEGMSELVAYVKLNDGLHNYDYGGPAIVLELERTQRVLGVDFGVFLDLKIFDVSATLINVLKKYVEVSPGILTISSQCSIAGFLALRRLLPNAKLALISVPTDISEGECKERFGMTAGEKILNDLKMIEYLYQKVAKPEDFQKPVDFIVCSAEDLPILNANLGDNYEYITPGIRDEWMKNPNEHQKRVTGVAKALRLGASLVVMGAQLTKGCPENNISPEESRRLTLEEIKNFRKEALSDGEFQMLYEG